MEKSSIDNQSLIQFNIEEIRSMRDEINWRVKIAYTSSVVFLSALAFTVSTVFSNENSFLETLTNNPDLRMKSGLVFLVLISAWVGVQNANHLIEKRIEMYTLSVIKVIYSRSNEVTFSWLGFLYGSRVFQRDMYNNAAKFLNASIGLFIYFLPNFLAIIVWIYLISIETMTTFPSYFFVVTFFLIVAVGSSALLFFYVLKVNKAYTEYYAKFMREYFEKHEPRTSTGS